jgi:CRP/FNR family transcriptional regulator
MYTPDLAHPIRHSLPVMFANAEPASLKALFQSVPAETVEVGQALFWEGDAAAHVFRVTEGCVRLYRILPDGRRAVTGFAFAGEFLALSCPKAYSCTAEAVTRVRLQRLSRGRFHAIVDESCDLRGQLMAQLCEEMACAQHHLIVLGQLSAEERVANFLTAAARRTEDGTIRASSIELPMSRLDIADYLGLTIETVCRVISKFKREGVIALHGRHSIAVRRTADLRDLAGGVEDVDQESSGDRAYGLVA